MNLKHSSKVSSLDALATKSMHKGGSFHLYRDITLADVAGTPAVMIPYYEDVNAISNALSNFSNEHDLSKSVVYGHLAVNGAIQNSSSSFRYHGALPPHLFAPVKRTFSGHFHVHQTLPNSILLQLVFICLFRPISSQFFDSFCRHYVRWSSFAVQLWRRWSQSRHRSIRCW